MHKKEEKNICGCPSHHNHQTATACECQTPKENANQTVSCSCHNTSNKNNDNHCSNSPKSCGCGCQDHHHSQDKRTTIIRICATIILLVAAIWYNKANNLSTALQLLLFLPAYLLIGYPTLHNAIDGIKQGRFFSEHLLMSVATLGALFIGFLPEGEPEFTEAIFVMLFFTVGELFEAYAEGKSRESISHLMNIRPDVATVIREGRSQSVAPETVDVGETILVRPGDKIPLDGIITDGTSTVNTSALTGESLPRDVENGDEVLSGCINLSGALYIKTTKPFGESTVAKIIRLVENSDANKSKSEAFISKFARIYTPIVIFSALLLALVPPLFLEGSYIAQLSTWVYRALTFLIVSCPCALVISVPLTFFGGIGGASRSGILIKGSNYLETLAKVDTIVFDKTGTLTHGAFEVSQIVAQTTTEQQLLQLAAAVEQYSTHPIALALRNAANNYDTPNLPTSNITEIAGKGAKAIVDGKNIAVGNKKMMEMLHIDLPDTASQAIGTMVHVAIDNYYAGYIVVSDSIKEDSQPAIQKLKNIGIKHTAMLSGDAQQVATAVADKLGIDECHAELMPVDKVERVETYLHSPSTTKLAFVGDGINDAPVLARADVGIAMGGLGSDAAIEAADVVIMNDQPKKIATAIQIARRTLQIAKQNIAFAIGIKIAVILLATVGYANIAFAIFADVGVTVLAVLNAMRALHVPKQYKQ